MKNSVSPQNQESETLTRETFRALLGDTRGGIHALLRSNDGLNPLEAVEEMMKIFFIKFFDELNFSTVIKSKNSRESANLKVDPTTDPEEFSVKVHQIFTKAKEWEAELLSQTNKSKPPSKMFTDDIRIEISPNTLMQIFGRLQNFSLHQSPVAIKGAIFEDFLGRTFRNDLGQYFTPTEVIELMIRMVEPTATDVIGDPCCGPARFLTHSLKYTHALYGADTSGAILKVAKINCLLNEALFIDLKKMDSLDPISSESNLGENPQGLIPEGCTIILTNPPFGMAIDDEVKLNEFSIIHKKKGQVESQILFIERCLTYLKPGGMLAMVVPESILDNKSSNDIRKWIYNHCQINAIISLPLETFKPYGTGIKTAIIILRKIQTEQKISLDRTQNRVFMGTIQNIGYDNTGKVIRSDDVENLLQTYLQFKNHVPIEAKYQRWYFIAESELCNTRFDVKYHECYPLDKTKFSAFCPMTDYVSVIDEKATPSKKYASDPSQEILYIGIDELENDPYYIEHPRTALAEDIGPSKLCQGGDILVARLGPSLTNRKSVLVNPKCKKIFMSSEFLVFRVKTRVDANFVLWLTKSQMFIDQGLAKSSGATPSRYRLHDEFISQIFVPVYPFGEQKRIGEAYWAGRSLINQRIHEIKVTQQQINPDF